MNEKNAGVVPAENFALTAAGFDQSQIGLCYRTGADPNPYPATEAQCIHDGGEWTPGALPAAPDTPE